MKKAASFAFVFIFAILLAACSTDGNITTDNKEGIYPYELSERETTLLQAFGMEGNSQIISFRAPREAIDLTVSVYRLDENMEWSGIGGGGISIGAEREPIDELAGTFTMQLQDDYKIDFSITAGGRASYTTHAITLDTDIMASVKGFLTEFQKIEINKEIPVALMIYDSGTSMRSHSLDEYFEPSGFVGMDLVQVVTLTFGDGTVSP